MVRPHHENKRDEWLMLQLIVEESRTLRRPVANTECTEGTGITCDAAWLHGPMAGRL